MIELKITGETAREIFEQLAELATGCAIPPMAEEAPKPKKNVKKTAETVKTEPTPAEPEAVTEGQEAAGTWEPGGGEVVEQPTEEPAGNKAPAYTFVDIRAKGIEAAGKHGQPAVKAVLTELGAKGMSELDESQYAAFVEKLEGLGDSNA